MSDRKPAEFATHPAEYADAIKRGLFRAVVRHVVDGDTVDVLLDLGWYQYAYQCLRLAGIDTPELRGTAAPVRAAAYAARDRVAALVEQQPVLLRSHRQETTFGRFVADVFLPEPAGCAAEWPAAERLQIGALRWVSLTGILLGEGRGRVFGG